MIRDSLVLSLARKELTESVLSARFLVSSLVAMVLVVTTILVLTGSYAGQFRDYQSRVRQQDEFIDSYGHYNRFGWMSQQMRRPSYFQVLVLGIDREARQENFVSNPVAALLPRLDFVTIVTIIFSLMAILFSYDAISGEREAGTLRLLLAAGAPRRSLLLGKFLGGVTSLLVPFSLGVLVGYLSIAVNPVVQLSGGDFVVFGELLVVSWIYIAVFSALGLLFSASSHTSGQSVLKSLFVWVILVLVIPNISPFLAAELYPLPSAAKIEQQKFSILDQERDQILREKSKEMQERNYPDLKPILSLSRPEIALKIQQDPALRTRYEAYSRGYDELIRQVNRQQQEKADKISRTFTERSKYQESLAKILTSFSPYADFVFVATDLTETGIEAENRWDRLVGEYSSEAGGYAEARYRKEKEKNPAYDSNDFLDLRGRPRFTYRPSSVTDRITNTAPQAGILLLCMAVFLAGGFIAFHRYDVR